MKRKRSSIERDLLSIYRRRGVLVPTSADEVLNAEELLDREHQAMPTSLASPPVLRSRRAKRPQQFWTNPSVLMLNADNPVDAITRKAREVVLRAIEQGWSGPPYDPQQLAELLRIQIVPDAAVVDARIRWNLLYRVQSLAPSCSHPLLARSRNRAYLVFGLLLHGPSSRIPYWDG
jgi:hypothetical protein